MKTIGVGPIVGGVVGVWLTRLDQRKQFRWQIKAQRRLTHLSEQLADREVELHAREATEVVGVFADVRTTVGTFLGFAVVIDEMDDHRYRQIGACTRGRCATCPNWSRLAPTVGLSVRASSCLHDGGRDPALSLDPPKTAEALATWDAFTHAIPDKLTSAHAYLATARDHAFICLAAALRARLARWANPSWAPESSNASCARPTPAPTSAPVRWSIAGLRDLLTVHTARLLHHPAWKEIKRATHDPAPSHSACKNSTLDDATEKS